MKDREKNFPDISKATITPLPRPKVASSAQQARELGLKVGSIIYSRVQGEDGSWWSDARLEFLWIGESTVAVKVWRCSSRDPMWRYAGESMGWKLTTRAWFLVE